MQDPKQYIANPDVSCREEGPDGALLFNPDNDQVVVVNATGLLIWEALDRPQTRDEVIAELVDRCDNVPMDQIPQDVGEFLERLVVKGFVGLCEGPVP